VSVRPRITLRRRTAASTDPLVHALLAGAVAAPLVPVRGRGPLVTAVVAGTLIDIDHPLAARSLRLGPMISMETRPRSHSLLTALGAGTLAGAAGGPAHGWAAFAGLASHLLYDAGDSAAPTPLLWPWASARQVGRGPALAGIAALALGSWGLSRLAGGGTARGAVPADGAGAAARPRTA
jgi:hypothetical protein